MANYFYMNDFPLTIAKGGKEEQLKLVAGYIRQNFEGVYDIHDENAPKIASGDTLHCFGDNPIFLHFSEFLKGNGIVPKLIISPSFYRRSSWVYMLLRLFPRKIPTWYSEREKMYKSFDRVIVNSAFEKAYLNRIFGLKNIEVVYNSFESTNHRGDTKKTSRGEYCLCVSHISERKNIFELMRAAEELFNSRNIRLVIAGGVRFHSHTNLKKFERELLKNRGVDFVGYQSKDALVELYENCKFHVLPSFIETPGISNLEACSFGKPIVVGDFPVVREYFGESAIYTGFKSSDILKAMKSALAISTPVKYDLSKFTTTRIAKQYSEIIEELYD